MAVVPTKSIRDLSVQTRGKAVNDVRSLSDYRTVTRIESRNPPNGKPSVVYRANT